MTAAGARRRGWGWFIAATVLIVPRAVAGARDWDLLADILGGAITLCLMASMFYTGWRAGHHDRARTR